jgi:hypothetical protein
VSRLLRTDLPDAVWDRLNEMAAADGVKIGVYAKRVLMAHAAVPKPEPVSDSSDTKLVKYEGPKPTEQQWIALNRWLAATERVPPKDLLITTRSGLMAWAREQGFKP